MDIIKGYGISVRNSPVDIKKTVSYQELTTIGISESDICIDVVRSDSASRPELDKLTETLGVGDRIDLYSIDTLLQGNKQVGTDYYRRIISKGIDLLVYDFGGAIARLSPFSTESRNRTISFTSSFIICFPLIRGSLTSAAGFFSISIIRHLPCGHRSGRSCQSLCRPPSGSYP